MIGWYVHHQGRGHLTRAETIRPHLDEPVTILSSLAPPPGDESAWVRLPMDDDVDTVIDATAHDRLHWVPYGSAGLAGRMARIAAWVAEARPRLVVVDVSVEVTLLVRLLGVPVVVFAGPGDRDDASHQLAYSVAERIIAAWPRSVYDPPFLHPHADRTTYVGAISRFDGRAASGPTGSDVLVLCGGGGSGLVESDVAAAEAASGRRWVRAGLPGTPWVEDVWPLLTSAAVVVTHAGQNALADVGAARLPAVVLPQTRPYAEQHSVADALRVGQIARTVATWPTPDEWPDVLDSALALGGHQWDRWSTGVGAQAAAATIAAVRA